MSNIQTGAERMPHDLSHLGFLAGQIGRLITISTTPVIVNSKFSSRSMVLMALLYRLITLLLILTMPLFLARLTLIPIKSLSICFRVIGISITTILKRRGCLTVPRLSLMSLIKMMLVMVSVAAISKTFGLLRFLLRLSFLAKSRLLPHLLTLWVCKLLMLICILTKTVITSCSVTVMLFLQPEVKPLMTLTTVLYLSCALISGHLAMMLMELTKRREASFLVVFNRPINILCRVSLFLSMALCLLLRWFVFRLLRLKRFSTLTLRVL